MGKCNADVTRLRGYRVEIYPTEEQKEAILKTINLYRASYNLVKGTQDRNYESGNKYIGSYDMMKRISCLRQTEEYYWLNQIPMSIIRQAIIDVDNAFKMFFDGKCRHPGFKSKRKSKKSFGTRSDRCRVVDNLIYVSGLPDGMRGIEGKKHHIPSGSKLYHCVVSFDGYRYWFSCQVERPIIDMSDVPVSEPVGIDVGVRNMMTTSDGYVYKFPDNTKLLKRRDRQHKRLHKLFNKYYVESLRTKTKYEDVPKSKNFEKKLFKLRQTYKRISNRNMNTIHNATKEIVSRNPECIVIENIKVTELQKRGWFNKKVPQPYFYEMRKQIEYKAADRNIPVIIADSNFPSSQMCSRCGVKHKTYGNKVFKCPACGLRIDRDLNAAYNLRDLAYRNVNSNTIEVA